MSIKTGKLIVLALLFGCSASKNDLENRDLACDCDKGEQAECNQCEYSSSIEASLCTATACDIHFLKPPQMDCNTVWLGVDDCGKNEANLFCQLIKKEIGWLATSFNIQEFDPQAGLISNKIINKDAIKLKNIPATVYPPGAFYYEGNPYSDVIKVLVLGPDSCIKQ